MSTDSADSNARLERSLGLGINASDFHTSYASSPLVDYLEVTAPSSRLRGSPSYRDVSRAPRGPGFERRSVHDLRETVKVLVHSTNVNPTYPVPCRDEDLRELRDLVRLTNSPWVTEDLGVWLMNERHVYPFFMPLVCTDEVLAVTIENVRHVQDVLGVPFNAEFPPMTAVVGDIHPFDFFRELTAATGCYMCVDLGHVLSFQLLRNASPMADTHRLPWSSITEIHIAGGGIDLSSHGFSYEDDHGDEEIVSICFDMLDDVIASAPRLQAITLELFGARMPNLALSRLQTLRKRPSVATWLGGDADRRAPVGTPNDDTVRRALRQQTGLYDLLHTDRPITGTVLVEAGSDVLDLFSVTERQRWDSVRSARLRLVGGTLADYFPVTLAALMTHGDMSADTVAARILVGTTDKADDYWPAVVSTFTDLVERLPLPEHVAEAFRCELWMNECVRSGDPAGAAFHVDALSSEPVGLLPEPLEISYTGDRFQVRRGSLEQPTTNVCGTAGAKGKAQCCTGR